VVMVDCMERKKEWVMVFRFLILFLWFEPFLILKRERKKMFGDFIFLEEEEERFCEEMMMIAVGI
jgi:hypothetical protein